MAAPIAGVVIGWMGGAAGIGAAIGVSAGVATALVELGVGLALSALGRALLPGPEKPQPAGIRSEVTLEGATLPQTMILGEYATHCYVVAPFYATGKIEDGDADIENAYRWMVLDIADYPIDSITAVWIGGKKFRNPTDFTGDIGTGLRKANPTTRPAYTEDVDAVQVRYYDGRQGVASTHLVNQFGDHNLRPWANTAIGKGVAYIIIALRFDTELFQGDPQILVEARGARLYNRSNDSTNGGSGTQRENNDTTWTWAGSQNPILQVENLMRGITLADGNVYGLGVQWADMPYSIWNQAKAACNQTVNGRNRYETGYEVRMATPDAGGDEPFKVIDELLKGCSGAITDLGGIFHVRAGPPALPVVSITDDDILIDHEQEHTLHDGVQGVYNAIRATFPNPAQQWKSTEGPIRRNTTYLAEDGEPLFAELPLQAVTNRNQVQQLTLEYLKDSRRKRAHVIAMEPRFSGYVPLQVISWNSTRRNYTNKTFEILDVVTDPETLCVVWSIREVNPNDYDPNTDTYEADTADDKNDGKPKLGLPGFQVSPHTVRDSDGVGRRPAIRMTWTKSAGLKWVTYEIRNANNQNEVGEGTVTDPSRKRKVHSAGLVASKDYEVRAKGNRTKWTPWLLVTTPAVRLLGDDLEDGIISDTKIAGGAISRSKIPPEDIVLMRQAHNPNNVNTPPAGIERLLLNFIMPNTIDNYVYIDLTGIVDPLPAALNTRTVYSSNQMVRIYAGADLIDQFPIRFGPDDSANQHFAFGVRDLTPRSGNVNYRAMIYRVGGAAEADFKQIRLRLILARR